MANIAQHYGPRQQNSPKIQMAEAQQKTPEVASGVGSIFSAPDCSEAARVFDTGLK
jgi:hypothetical protein